VPPPLLAAQGLRKSFGDTRAVDGVDFSIESQRLISLVGSNGAGKTTLVNLITGLLLPDEGRIVFDGQDVTRLPIYGRIKAGIARSFQLVNLFDALPVLDNVRLAVFSRDNKIHQAMRLAERDREAEQEARDVIGEFGLANKWNVLASGLAQGERKLLDVAVAYALRPKLMLLDEPTSGVGTREKSQIMDRVASVVRSGGLSAVTPQEIVRDDRVAAMLGRREGERRG
jgi:branched-chain amino acid transport system ATP-binding protein